MIIVKPFYCCTFTNTGVSFLRMAIAPKNLRSKGIAQYILYRIVHLLVLREFVNCAICLCLAMRKELLLGRVPK
jgi:hypothetical protein